MPIPLPLPNRVSRLYPVFSLILALTSSIFFYAWQSTELEVNRLATVEQRDLSLHAQIDQLTAQQKLDQSQLALQNKRISDATTQLTVVQQELKSKSDDLTSKETQLQQAQTQLKAQQDQLTQNASELDSLRSRPPLFSFQNNSNLTDVSQKEADVKALVSSAYDYIQQLYGAPYLLNSITITFVNSFSISGSSGEIIIENGPKGISINIHLLDFDKTSFQDINTVIHEIIHGFHGVAVLTTSALEEGMTVAATDAVMQKMMADHKIPQFDHLYLTLTPAQYDEWNTSLRIPANNQNFYASQDISKIYQLIGAAWYKLYQQDPDFFKKLNAAYYPKVQKGTLPDNALILDSIRSIVPTVGGQSINTFLSSNQAFNPN